MSSNPDKNTEQLSALEKKINTVSVGLKRIDNKINHIINMIEVLFVSHDDEEDDDDDVYDAEEMWESESEYWYEKENDPDEN